MVNFFFLLKKLELADDKMLILGYLIKKASKNFGDDF